MPDDPATGCATHDNIMSEIKVHKRESDDRFERGNERFVTIAADIAAIKEIVLMIPNIQADVATTMKEVSATKEIVEAWAAVKTMGKFIKWASGIIAAAGIIFASAKFAAIHLFKG